ncbi:MAG TPA: sulfite exporter TauE/SafE family protein [Polyangiaceae bacterium]|nr:sulfite exporter TauE/SafE family protein [Polyangiaceae bacterium]
MHFSNGLLLAVAASVGGALNSVAGGGSFLTFPALVVAGIDPITANATSSVVLWPAAVASAFAYRSELVQVRRLLPSFGVVSALGGFAGAALLLGTKSATFSRLVPWLLLVAALVFTFGKRLVRARSTPRLTGAGGALFQFIVALYGGYFGGGMGIVMLAAYAAMGFSNIHAMNALKNTLAVLINFAAITTFIVMGKITWAPGLWMLGWATASGYGAARFSRRLDAAWVRRFVILVAWAMTAFFFFRAYR